MAQSYQCWEAIIVDDGSQDQSVSVAREFAALDSRFRQLSRSGDRKKGACSCRNIGLENAEGGLVVFLDSDDLLSPRALEARSSFMACNSHLDFCVSGTSVFDRELGDVSRYRCFPEKTTRSDLFRFLMFDQPWLTTGPTWRTEFLQGEKLTWDEDLSCWQDWFFHLVALNRSQNYLRMSGSDSGWRRGTSGKISQPGKVDPENLRGLFSPLEARLLEAEKNGVSVAEVLPLVYFAAVRMRGYSAAVFDYPHPCRLRDYALATPMRRLLLRANSLPKRVRGLLLKRLASKSLAKKSSLRWQNIY